MRVNAHYLVMLLVLMSNSHTPKHFRKSLIETQVKPRTTETEFYGPPIPNLRVNITIVQLIITNITIVFTQKFEVERQ